MYNFIINKLFFRKNLADKIFDGFPITVQSFADDAVDAGFADVIHLAERFTVVNVTDMNFYDGGGNGF